jgi:hypothetical protein
MSYFNEIKIDQTVLGTTNAVVVKNPSGVVISPLTDTELRAAPLEVTAGGHSAGQQLTQVETLQLILSELRVLNIYMHQLPAYLNAGKPFSERDSPHRLAEQLLSNSSS